MAVLAVLSTSAKLRKGTLSFVMPICPSFRMELGSHWTDYHEI